MKAPRITTLAVFAVVIALFFAFALWPRAVPVDMAELRRGPMMTSIDEEAKAQVRDVYSVSMPTAGRLMRVAVEPGDPVIAGESIVARMMPSNPQALDIRTEEQARAAVEAAEGALALAEADALRTQADLELAETRRERFAGLYSENAGSRADLDRAERDLAAAEAALRSARATIRIRRAELESARAMLMSFTAAQEEAPGAVATGGAAAYPIVAPSSGVVLRVVHESETTLPAGAAILQIGDPHGDLEIHAELLSTDAVRVAAGDRVIVERWGGACELEGIVERVEPWAFTKVSALGIEEQRVNVRIRLIGDPAGESGLGHGYRTHVRIVTWEAEDVLQVPVSALFREGEGWSLFLVEGGRARKRSVQIGRRNETVAELRTPLPEGATVILYPGDALEDGLRVMPRG